ncbi:hypothetical protein VTI74DRAFT_2625 [Chaetomium olivicolor]
MRNDETDPINMENMPRPHRRRREKKLMPIDEVNEKFPMLKYKTWVASRAQEGLPTRGGVSAPPSRANSIRDVTVPSLPPKERMSTDERPTTSATAKAPNTANETCPDIVPEKREGHAPQHVPKESTSSTVGAITRTSTESNRDSANTVAQKHMSQVSHDDDDEDEHIDSALPPECLGTSGDTCAICIDSLEDDDDVRGLTCGHAFHAACIDPWLTTRRACCPLCKADYYTPKPRPQAVGGGDGTTGVITVTLPTDSRGHRMNLPTRPSHAFFGFRRSNRRGTSEYTSSGQRRTGESQPGSGGNIPTDSSDPAASPQYPGSGILTGLRGALSGLRTPRPQNPTTQNERNPGTNPPETTPSQLEAGGRNQQS